MSLGITVRSAFFCERAAKLVNGRTVAFGMLGGTVSVPKAHIGNVFNVSMVMTLGTMNVGRSVCEFRILGLDGKAITEHALPIEIVDLNHTAEIILDNMPIVQDRRGRLILQFREQGGTWREAAWTWFIPEIDANASEAKN